MTRHRPRAQRSRRAAVSVLVTVPLLLATASATAPARAASAAPTGSITVFAAASLTEAFTAIGRAFERRHPDTQVTFSFGASSLLAAQVGAGAPADVFAAADESDVEEVRDALEGAPSVFATNRLAIAVEPGNPRHIRDLADTVDSDVILVLCAAAVPCGALARQAYRRAGVTLPEVASAEHVKAALTTVILGEADAAVVYATDVRAAGDDVDGVGIPRRHNVTARYPIASLRAGERPALARAFVEFVLSDRGQQIMRSFGFRAP